MPVGPVIRRLQVAAVIAAMIAAAILWLRHDAVTDERNAHAADQARAAEAAHERMNHAPVSTGNPDDDLDWLRQFGRATAGPR